MNIKKKVGGGLVLCLSLLLLLSFQTPKPDQTNLTISRILWFYSLKKQLALRAWPGFDGSDYNVDLAYFTSKSTFLIDPENALKGKNKLQKVYSTEQISIYSTERLDTNQFHMSTAYESQDSTLFWYQHPVMMCSDYETTHQTQQDVNDLQTWATMVMHEYFHGFQFRHKAFIRYANDSITVSNSRLQSYYDNYAWFKQSIEKENSLLLACLNTSDNHQVEKLFKRFKYLREHRRKYFSALMKFNLGPQEDFLEKMEGSSRYIEFKLYKTFSKIPRNKRLERIDTAYKKNIYRNFNLKQKSWMYQSNSIRYFYSTGFNMIRLMDKLNISYKENFFDDNNLTPYQILCQHLL
ncbi:hypothetical protein ACPPVU_00610 [Mucilaginibacter sp. McL0603]|uniref:hypothetical protein n=1 Tax=Mucilaginibacter sp. McL0603 TaxID=3415670 RepID=UPI003CF9E110